MALLRRRTVPEVVKSVALDRGERRVAWALTTDGEPVVATNVGLRLPGGPMLTWDRIERASFSKPVLTVLELARVEGAGAAYQVVLDLDGDVTDLPETVRTRVAGSVAWSSHTKLAPAGGVRIVGRRRPGSEVLDWQLVFDRDTDPDDPGLRAQAESFLDAARRTIG